MKRVPDNFLKEEVRNGFFIPAAIKQAWAAELEVLLEIDRVCKKHDIEYYADWGTLLGAVRHGGYIPWDDDIDIVMKRDDYLKFLSVANELEDGFYVQTYETQPDYWLFMAKVVGKNNICFEPEHLRRFHNFPFIACIDIFVLDYVYADEDKEEKRKKNCLYALAVADSIINGELSESEIASNIKIIENSFGISIKYSFEDMKNGMRMGRILYRVIENEFVKSLGEPSKGLVQLFPWGLKGVGKIYPLDYYSNPIRLPFEFTTIPVPAAYDRMLSDRYGDYLKVNKNAGAHDYPFFEGQKAELEKTMGFSMPKYDFAYAYKNKDMNLRNEARTNSLKSIVKDCIAEIMYSGDNIIRSSVDIISSQQHGSEKLGDNTLTELVEAIQNLQTFVIDLGNLIESVKGDNHPVIQDLEMVCERLYDIYVGLNKETIDIESMTNAVNAFQQVILQISEVIEKKLLLRKSVLFLPTFYENWKSMEHAFETSLRNCDFDVYVMPLPYYYKDYDGQPVELLCDAELFPGKLMPIDYKTVSEEKLQLLWPDYIFIDNPYDEWNPAFSTVPAFYSSNIWKYTDNLILLSPHNVGKHSDEEQRSIKNARYYVGSPGFVYADMILLNNDSHVKMCKKSIHDLIFHNDSKNTGDFESDKNIEIADGWIENFFLNDGKLAKSESDVDNKCAPSKQCFANKKSLLYCVSLGRYYEYKEKFTYKLENVLSLFNNSNEHEKLSVSICTYPDGVDGRIWEDFLEEVKRITEKNYFDMDPVMLVNVLNDEDVENYDAYYGDASPYVLWFSERNKPVMIQDYDI